MNRSLHIYILLVMTLFITYPDCGFADSTLKTSGFGATTGQNFRKESRVILDEDFYWATSRAATDKI